MWQAGTNFYSWSQLAFQRVTFVLVPLDEQRRDLFVNMVQLERGTQ